MDVIEDTKNKSLEMMETLFAFVAEKVLRENETFQARTQLHIPVGETVDISNIPLDDSQPGLFWYDSMRSGYLARRMNLLSVIRISWSKSIPDNAKLSTDHEVVPQDQANYLVFDHVAFPLRMHLLGVAKVRRDAEGTMVALEALEFFTTQHIMSSFANAFLDPTKLPEEIQSHLAAINIQPASVQ